METRMRLKSDVGDFIDLFENELPRHSSRKAAYDSAERQHEHITGNRRYTDWESFRTVLNRRGKKTR